MARLEKTGLTSIVLPDSVESYLSELLVDNIHRSKGIKPLLPDYQAVIIDEGHKFLDAARIRTVTPWCYSHHIKRWTWFESGSTLAVSFIAAARWSLSSLSAAATVYCT